MERGNMSDARSKVYIGNRFYKHRILLLAGIAVVLVLAVVSVNLLRVGGKSEEEKNFEAVIENYPPQLQEVVTKANSEIKKSPEQQALGWQDLKADDFVRIVFVPGYKDTQNSPASPAFVVVNYKPSLEAQAKKIVEDYFKDLGVEDLSTVKIVWNNKPEFVK
jgi:hypothetical protein